jgi:hypothetical protein
MNEERDIVRADFQDDLSAPHLAVSIAEPRVEEAGIVGAQFAAGRFVGDHLRGITRRHPNALFGRQDIKLLRFQEETVLPVPFQRFPEVECAR